MELSSGDAGGVSDQVEAGKAGSRVATQAPGDANHLFANNVRFLSMAAIIALHVMEGAPGLLTVHWAVLQIPKFGTIDFFLVAGFLFGERIDRYSSAQYYTRRLKNVALPWTVWYLIYCMLVIAAGVVNGRIQSQSLSTDVLAVFEQVFLDSTYWFVPNLMVALAVLLAFRPILRDSRVGFVFLVVSLFYAANIYGCWLPVKHTRAVFGFVFYLWLGAWASWHFEKIRKVLSHISIAGMAGIVIVTGVLAFAETRVLSLRHSEDPLNTLRFTNQIYSVVVLMAFMKLKRAAWPRFIDVRAHTFGLYLTHAICIALLMAAVKRIVPHLPRPGAGWSVPLEIISVIAAFSIVYAGSLLMVRALLSVSWLRWSAGVAGYKTKASTRSGEKGPFGTAPLVGSLRESHP